MKIVFESAFIVSQLKWDEIVGYFYCFLLTIKILYEVQSLRGHSWSQFHVTTIEFYLSKTIVLQNNWMLKVESPGRIISLTADIEIKYNLDITSIRWRRETIFLVDNIFSGQGLRSHHQTLALSLDPALPRQGERKTLNYPKTNFGSSDYFKTLS